MRRALFAVIAGLLLVPVVGCSEKPAENNSKSNAPLPSGPGAGAGAKGGPTGPPKPPPPLPGKNP